MIDAAEETPRKTVLLVEDDDAIAAIFEQALSVQYNVFRVSSVPAAQEALTIIAVDAIVLDWQLGTQQGSDLLNSLPRVGTKATPPTIVTSGNATDEEALEAGAEMVLHKPFSLTALRESVERLLNQQTRLRPK